MGYSLALLPRCFILSRRSLSYSNKLQERSRGQLSSRL
uniref:Uncharacterized protein n=1 Tax=Utricularia reniformis TaxID=192314 RepID=A0A1Y0B3E8_9LAMI|nr:hypothetical protein AEK19_MT1741 [Utricularia reniformis]ART31918.1 hypothetical protein AEK19_MT1741 [Utricularia reniformis]